MTTEDESLFQEPATASKLNLIFEAVVVTSLTVAVLSLFLFAWIGDGIAHDRTAGLTLRYETRFMGSPLPVSPKR